MNIFNYSIGLFGDTLTGKTHVFRVYAQNKDPTYKDYMGTIGNDVEKIVDQYGIKALIWYHACRTNYRNIVLHLISRFDFIL